MIHRYDGLPHGRAVTALTGLRRQDVVVILAGGGHTVVAACTVPGDIAVIEKRRCPAGSLMTGVTGLLGIDMRRRYSNRVKTIVAARALPHDGTVIHAHDRRPGRGAVTIGALVGGHDVIRRSGRSANSHSLRVTA